MDLIVDLRPPGQRQAGATWTVLAPHVRRAGHYVIVAPAARDLTEEYLHDDNIAARHESGAVRRRAGSLMVQKPIDHLVLLTDRGTATLLEKREPAVSLSVVRSLPPGTLVSTGRAGSHGMTPNRKGLSTEMNYPAMRVRHYRGPFVFHGNTLLYTGHSAVSDSFRRYLGRSAAKNPALERTGSRMARMPTPPARRQLTGSYYLLDPQFTGHFGHITTEVIPRLWAWDQAKADDPDLKALYRARAENPVDPILSTFLSAFGIAEADQCAVHEPVAVDSVLCASAMWHGQNADPHFVHPGIVEVWERLAAGLVDPDAVAGPTRVFVARPTASRKRYCRNAADVEAFFVRHGFTIVRPEEHGLRAQATLFRDAEVVAGFAGSGMFNAMYSKELRNMIVLSHYAYLARHENKFAAARNADIDYFWSTPDKDHAGKLDFEAFNSSWDFDLDAHGPTLHTLLS